MFRPFLLPHWWFRVGYKMHAFDNTSPIVLSLFWKKIILPQGGKHYRYNTSRTRDVLIPLSKCVFFHVIKERHHNVFVFLCCLTLAKYGLKKLHWTAKVRKAHSMILSILSMLHLLSPWRGQTRKNIPFSHFNYVQASGACAFFLLSFCVPP